MNREIAKRLGVVFECELGTRRGEEAMVAFRAAWALLGYADDLDQKTLNQVAFLAAGILEAELPRERHRTMRADLRLLVLKDPSV